MHTKFWKENLNESDCYEVNGGKIIKLDLTAIDFAGVDWTNPAQDRDQ
jgi:hypothetical protein